MITDNPSSTNTPQTTGSSSSCLIRIATVPSAPPSASEPTSPMKTSAGCAFHQRKPRLAPTSDPQKMVNSPMGSKWTSRRYFAKTACPVTYVSAVYVAAETVNVLIASPSSPSVRFTVFDMLTSTSAANGMYHQVM